MKSTELVARECIAEIAAHTNLKRRESDEHASMLALITIEPAPCAECERVTREANALVELVLSELHCECDNPRTDADLCAACRVAAALKERGGA